MGLVKTPYIENYWTYPECLALSHFIHLRDAQTNNLLIILQTNIMQSVNKFFLALSLVLLFQRHNPEEVVKSDCSKSIAI